ncbi:hypothetical protein KHQ89_05095 [Mycoplasmatota bacterium]|nr:hypothetical protein KHQ89_05095 [Mycoplasmatota bacterium]
MFAQNRKHEKLLSFIIILLSILGLFLQLLRAYQTGFFFPSIIFLLIYFTNQSSLLVFAAVVFIYFNYKKKWFDIFAFIAFANITITGLIFHIFLVPHIDHLLFIHHLLHTIIPILYFVLYMFFLETNLKIKQSFYALIYPIIYFIFVYIIVHPLLGGLIHFYYPNEPDMLYVYPFLNPNNYVYGFSSVLLFVGLILLPIFSLLFYLLFKFKLYINHNLREQKNAYLH